MEIPDSLLIKSTYTDFKEVVFISKDAILKWLEQEVLELNIYADDVAVAWGQRNAFKQVIDKINSM